MKKPFLIAILAVLPLIAVVADPNQKDKNSSKSSTQSQPPGASSTPGAAGQSSRLQENMIKMHEQMHKIMSSKNAQDRQRLTREHARLMEETIPLMQGSQWTSTGTDDPTQPKNSGTTKSMDTTPSTMMGGGHGGGGGGNQGGGGGGNQGGGGHMGGGGGNQGGGGM